MAVLCNTSDPTWSSDAPKRDRCRNAVNTMYAGMNSWWHAVRRYCGKWPFPLNGQTYPAGVYPSTNCNSANSNLRTNAFYTQKDGVQVKVDLGITDSTNVGLWSKVTTA
jgi:hypothetical protein